MDDTYEREARARDFRDAARTADVDAIARSTETPPMTPTSPTMATDPITTPSTPISRDPGPATYTGPRTDTHVVDRTEVVDRAHVRDVEPPVERRRFSLGATFLGWCVATFFSLLFLGVLIGALGGTAANDYYYDAAVSDGTIRTAATAGIVGYLVATFLAYLIGGYAAGRISLWDGAKHGALTVMWMVLAGILLFVAGAYANEILNDYVNIALPFSAGDVTGATLLWALGSVLAAALGGALGGRIGERYHDAAGTGLTRRRAHRGRPL